MNMHLRTLRLPAVALAVGLLFGLGAGQMQVKKEREIHQGELKEKDRKFALIQKKMAEEKAEATALLEQQCRDDMRKLQASLRGERKKAKVLSGRVTTLAEEAQKLDVKARAADETTARTTLKLQETLRSNKDLDRELKKTAEEKQSLQVELKRTVKKLGGQLATLSEQAQQLEAKARMADETTVKTKRELQETQRSKEDLDRELKNKPQLGTDGIAVSR
jgi:chromosome segregation ATPase